MTVSKPELRISICRTGPGSSVSQKFWIRTRILRIQIATFLNKKFKFFDFCISLNYCILIRQCSSLEKNHKIRKKIIFEDVFSYCKFKTFKSIQRKTVQKKTIEKNYMQVPAAWVQLPLMMLSIVFPVKEAKITSEKAHPFPQGEQQGKILTASPIYHTFYYGGALQQYSLPYRTVQYGIRKYCTI